MADLTVPTTGTEANPFVQGGSQGAPVAPSAPAAAPKPAAAQPSDTGAAVDSFLSGSATGAQASISAAFGANPDYEAELSRLSKQTGVPIDSARKNVEQVKQQAAMGSIDFGKLAAQYPSTTAFYQKQANANVAHDDIHNLANVESATSGAGAPYAFDGSGTYGALPFRQRISNMISDVSPMLGAVFNGEPLPTSSDPTRQAASDAINGGLLDQFTQAAGSSGSLGIIPGTQPAPGDTGGQVATGLGGLAGFFAGPLGIGRAAVAGVEKIAPLAVQGSESLLKAGAKTATASALELGAASAAGSAGDALNASDVGAAAETVAKAGGTGAAMGGAMGALSRVLPDNTVLQAVTRVAGSNVLNDAITGARPWDDRPLGQKIVDYGVNSLFSLPGAGRTSGSWLHDAARAEIAAGDGRVLADINASAPQSKLRERDPDAFRDFVEQANESGPLQHVYVDGDVLTNALNQAGVSREELAQKLPDVAEQLDLANQTGGQVQISIPDFATHLTGDRFQDNLLEFLRTDPEGMTLGEAKQFRASAADQFATHAESAFNDAELRGDHELSTQTVRDQVLSNLNEVNRFPADTNSVYASMIGGFYGTMAERVGMSPEEMFAKYPLRIAAEDVTGTNTLGGEPTPDNPLAKLSTIAMQQAGEVGPGGYLREGMIHPDDWKILKDAGLVEDIPNPDGTTTPGVSGLDLGAERERRFAAEKANRKPVTNEEQARGKEQRANNYARAAAEQEGEFGDPERAKELRAKEAELRADAAKLRATPDAPNAVAQDARVSAEDVSGANALSQATRLPDEVFVGPTGTKTTPHPGKTLLHETSPESAAAIIGDDLTNHARGVRASKLFLTDDPALAIGQGGKGVRIEFDGGAVSAKLHEKPGTGIIGGNEFKADAMGNDAITRVTVENGGDLPLSKNQRANFLHRFDKIDQSDGSVDYVRKGLNQVAQGERGRLSFADDISTAPSTITLLKNADLSTFLHESGHHFLNVLDHVAQTGPDDVKSDMKAVADWFGTTPEAWRAMSLEEKRPMHEQFARGFEAYLREGNSPNIEMRSVFQKMRAWLVNVYRNIAQLGVSLSPEVRGVFDRLLASNAEIQLAEASRSYAPLFKSPEEAGMTPDDYASYQALGNEATMGAVEDLQGRTLRDMKWLENRKDDALRGVKKDVAQKRAAMEETVRAELEADPVYEAREAINGSAKNIDPDLVAERFGFSSGDEMLQKIGAAPDIETAVREITDSRMLAQYGDISSPEAMNQAADSAIHNAARTRFIATEFKALAKAVGPVRELARAAKDVAERTIAGKRIRDLSPAMFTAAETRAAKIAESLRIKGDIAGAAKAKRDQLLNNQLARAAMDAQADVDSDLRYLRKFDTPKKSGDVDPEYRQQIEQLLDQYDLRRSTTLTDIGKRKSLADYVKRQEESTGLTPDIPQALLMNSTKVSYKDMTVEAWHGLIDAVKSIEHTGKLKHELLTAADERDFEDFITKAAATIRENGGDELAVKLERNQLGDPEKSKLAQFLANHRTLGSLLQQMDGRDGGFLWDTIVRPMNDRGVQEATMRAKATKELHDILKPIANEKLREKVFIPEINNSLSREGILSIALNWGNEVNQRRVMQGDKWSPAQVTAILKHLSSSDWRVVQSVWDHIDSYWPEISAKYQRVFGITPQKVEATPVRTPTGERLRGGYYPIKYDADRASRAESNDEAATLKQMMAGAYTRATTRRGFTESRLDEVKMPIRKDLGVITQHIDEVTHDLAWHEWLLDANRILGDKQFEDAVRDHYGPEVMRTMKATLKTIAGGDLNARQTMSAAMAFLRNGVAVSRLGYNLSTMLKQFAGIGPTAAIIGSGNVARGMSEYMGSIVKRAGVTKRVDSLSDFMRIRGQNIDRELSSIRDQINAGSHPIIEAIGKVIPVAHALRPASEAIARSFLGVIEATQRQVDMVSWLGAFRKAQDEGFAQDKAVSYADQVVRDSQGSGLVSDRPEIMTQDKLRLWTMFYGAQNAQYNVLAKAKGQGGSAKLAYALALSVVLPSIFNVAVSELRGTTSNEDWPTRLAKDLGWETLGNTMGMLVGLREIPGLLQFGYRGPSALAPLGDAARFAQQAAQGESDEGFWRSANMLGGDVFHYPAGMLDRIGTGYMAWVNGGAAPTALLFGAPSKQ